LVVVPAVVPELVVVVLPPVLGELVTVEFVVVPVLGEFVVPPVEVVEELYRVSTRPFRSIPLS
jgi:hypothetical protein